MEHLNRRLDIRVSQAGNRLRSRRIDAQQPTPFNQWRQFACTLSLAVFFALLFSACTTPTPTALPPSSTVTAQPTAPASEPLYLAIIWHQHQPIYFRDPQTGIYAKPWVRLHAAKDYLDMVTTVEKYKDVHVTFNITPSLIRQLDDLAAGAKDLYQVMAEKPAAALTNADKEFLLRRFFDINPKIIARFPRYKELADLRKGATDTQIADALKAYATQDYLDLQVLFNLAWSDPDWLAQPPLQTIVAKGKGFSEADKKIVFDEHLRIIKQVIPEHAQAQQAGQIQVTMTPYAHPILPLLYNTDLAKIAMGNTSLPQPRFSHPEDAIAQLKRGIESYQSHFNQPPRGMWPAEGAVAQEIVKMVSDNGIQWMASDEQVLAKSIGLDDFTRDSHDTIQQADKLYRTYNVQYEDQRPVTILFRDHVISDKVGFEYSGTPGDKASDDFMARLRAIKDRLKAEGATGPHLVTVLLDGENAWEYYDNDGKEFLNTLYTKLAAAQDIKTVTPSEYIALHPAAPKIDKLWAGSWINHNFDTWIGEDEENRAWDYLRRTRDELDKFVYGQKPATQKQIDQAFEAMYAAEGSDWFWWFGDDQDSGDDAAFDDQFRSYLTEVYRALGVDPPDFLYVPILYRFAADPPKKIEGMFSPKIDGEISPVDEWAKGAVYSGTAKSLIAATVVGYNAQNIYLRLDATKPWKEIDPNLFVGVYLSAPKAKQFNSFSRYGIQTKTSLGFGASHEIAIQFKNNAVSATVSLAQGDNTWDKSDVQAIVAANDRVIELALPWASLGDVSAGDNVLVLATFVSGGAQIATAPSDGAARIVLPDLSNIAMFLTVKDAKGDDKGPGSYTYPTDAVFKPGNFDIDEFAVGADDKNIVFRFKLNGPIDNPWGSPNGLAVQTLDVYIDVDHKPGSGSRMLLPGRNAAVSSEDAWDYAIWTEGWTPGMYKVGSDGKPVKMDVPLKIIVDPVARTVTLRLPKDAIPGDPKTFGYLGVMLGQEGFPAAGVWRVRDVEPNAAQWRFGGGAQDTNHTRIIDVAWDGTPSQEELLTKYKSSQESALELIPSDDFAQLRMTR